MNYNHYTLCLDCQLVIKNDQIVQNLTDYEQEILKDHQDHTLYDKINPKIE